MECVLKKGVLKGGEASRQAGKRHFCECLLGRCDFRVTARLAAAGQCVAPLRGREKQGPLRKMKTGRSSTVNEGVRTVLDL